MNSALLRTMPRPRWCRAKGLRIRPECYENDESAKQELSGIAELIIAKQRNGPTDEVPLTFLKQYTRFESRADR
jgi:replicative DNA helicase